MVHSAKKIKIFQIDIDTRRMVMGRNKLGNDSEKKWGRNN